MSNEKLTLEPPLGDRLLTWEDLDTLDQYPNDQLRKLAEGGAMKKVTPPLTREQADRAISASRLLYARLLAGLIPPEDIDATERALTGLIDAGGWPWWKSDMKCIRLAISGCGFMPGYPLKDEARHEQVRAEQARAS